MFLSFCLRKKIGDDFIAEIRTLEEGTSSVGNTIWCYCVK